METLEDVRRRVRREKQLATRLQLATTRLETAQQERIWAIAAAYEAGLSIRKIAAATGLSPSRVHQLLSNEEAREIPGWLSPLREQGLASEEDPLADKHSFLSTLQICLADEMEVLRWCLEWLERLDRGEDVVVNRDLIRRRNSFVLIEPGCFACWPGLSLTWTNSPASRLLPLKIRQSLMKRPGRGTDSDWLNRSTRPNR
jgi:hypothetical protein